MFRTIVADPPWDYEETQAGDGCWDRPTSRSEGIYDKLSAGEVCSLPLEEFVASNAYCFLWITNRHLLEGFGARVLRAWGFRPMTTVSWCKPLGLGYYVRNSHENVAFGVRGKPGRFNDTMKSWFEEGRQEHSEKPPVFYETVEKCCGGPYLELFAREPRSGWTVWGDEVGDSLGIGFVPSKW